MPDGVLLQQQDWQLASRMWSHRNARLSSARSAAVRPASAAEHRFVGQKKGLIILAEFPNKAFVTPDARTYFDRVANERGFHEGAFVGSVKDYFFDQSKGLFDLDFDVVGPVCVSHDYDYYGAPGAGEVDVLPWEMLLEACMLVDPEVDFSRYDWDGDGVVEQVFVLYAGLGQSTSGDPNTIWPHEYELSSVHKGDVYLYPTGATFDGVTVDTYACANEVRPNGDLEGIGTICHEFSHCMGLPDTYDVFYTGNYGMGPRDVMSHGEYNGDGFIPAGYDSYEKMVCGWQQPIELRSDTTVHDLQALAANGDSYVIYNEAQPDEYYLLESRQPMGWDVALPASGLLVLHVDYDASVWESNIVNSTVDLRNSAGSYNTHQRLTIVHADNEDDRRFWRPSWSGWTTNTHETDLYPYLDNDSLTDNSLPAAELWNANSDGSAYLNRGIHHITQHPDGSMSFDFSATSSKYIEVDTTLVDRPDLSGAIFYESFNRCLGTGGNDGLFKGSSEVASAPFVPDNGGWDSLEKGGGARCAKFGNASHIGLVTSPCIRLDGREMLLEFNAAPWSRDDTELLLHVEGDASLGCTELEMTEGEWTRFSVKLQGQGTVRIVFEPGKRFFLDEVVVRDPAASSDAIRTLASDHASEQRVNLFGQPAGKAHSGWIISSGRLLLQR